MSIQINTNALKAFDQLQFQNNKTIVGLKNGVLGENGIYKGPLSALRRSDAEKAENNAVRTQLLESLGKVFGMELETGANDKVYFSESFMETLEKHLGSDFKRSDFGLNDKGEVTSGKPLTMRRIEAIVSKVKTYAHNVKNSIYPLSQYEAKLDQMKVQLNKTNLDNAALVASSPTLKMAQACMQVLEKASFGTPLISYNYLNDGLLLADPRNPTGDLTISSFSHLKVQLEDLFGRGVELNGITLNEDLFNLDISEDEGADHPLNEVAQQINAYIEQQANAFLQALFLNAEKTQSSTNDAIGGTTIESFIRNLNATNIE